LVVGALIVGLGLYGLAFPATTLGGSLLLPLILSAWFFGWRGGLLCLAGVTLLLGGWYGIVFGKMFWSSAWFVPCVLGTLYGLVVCVAVGLLRQITDALQSAHQATVRAERAYEQEYALNVLREQARDVVSPSPCRATTRLWTSEITTNARENAMAKPKHHVRNNVGEERPARLDGGGDMELECVTCGTRLYVPEALIEAILASLERAGAAILVCAVCNQAQLVR